MKQIWNIVASRPKLVFSRAFIFCIPICPDNCGVVFLWKYFSVFEKWIFSFDRSNMHIFTVTITQVVWSHVANIIYLRYFCQHNPLFYHPNLIPCHYWSWQRNIYFLVNIFVRHTFPMSKVASNKDSFNNDRYDRLYYASMQNWKLPGLILWKREKSIVSLISFPRFVLEIRNPRKLRCILLSERERNIWVADKFPHAAAFFPKLECFRNWFFKGSRGNNLSE